MRIWTLTCTQLSITGRFPRSFSPRAIHRIINVHPQQGKREGSQKRVLNSENSSWRGLIPISHTRIFINNIKRLVILGEYEITVRKGQVTLLGATLGPSESSYRVFAPSTHSLPVLRCLATDINDAEIELRQCDSGINLLKSLSSLFGKLWNDDTGALGHDFAPLLKRKKRSTFQIVLSHPYYIYFIPNVI